MERTLAARPEETEVMCNPCLPGAEQRAYHSARRNVAASCNIIVSLAVGEDPLPVDCPEAARRGAVGAEPPADGVGIACYTPMRRDAVYCAASKGAAEHRAATSL